MKIWIDADACPKAVKDIVYRVADRRKIQVTLVANTRFPVPSSEHITFLVVQKGYDQADQAIAQHATQGDLVITADIPLAAAVMDKGGHALSPRGELFSPETIRSRLTMRDFLDELRGSGVMTGGPAAYGPRDRQAFANQLDRFLTSHGC